jgi:hypothetical protein
MATTNYTLTNIAIKRVSGKAQVSINNNVNQELIGSSVQSSNSTVFGETVPNAPAQTLYLVQSASVSDPGTAMYVEFNVYPIGDSLYANNPVAAGSDDEGDVTTNTYHAYALYLSSAFDDEVVDFDTHASTGTSFGSFPFAGGSYLTGSAGKFQLIPSFLSTDTSTNNSYIPTLYSNEGAEMQASDPSDWYLDPFSGILFIQDPTQYGTPNGDGSSPNTSTSIPGKIRAFIYVGKYQDEVTFGAGDVNFIVSGSDDGFAVANDGTINFVSGSAGITVLNDGTDTITIGASTDNITVNQITASIINADTIEATEFIVSSSVTYMTQSFSSGSTIFGDTNDDTHEFTGSLYVLHTGSDYGITLTGSGLTIDSGDGASISASGFISASDLYLTDTLTALDGGVTVIANASAELEVEGNITSSAWILATGSDSDGVAGFILDRAGKDQYRIEHLDNGLTINNQTDSRKEMTFDGSGKIGINNPIPTAQLHISSSNLGLLVDNSTTPLGGGVKVAEFIHRDGTNNPRLSISSSDNGIMLHSSFSTGINGEFRLQANGGSSFINFATGDNGEHMRLTSDGKLGIGTTTPSEKLTVEGNISASGFVSGSDLYVTDTLTALDGGVTVTSNANPELYVAGNITASGDMSASGLLFASASDDGGSVGSIAVAMYDTASGRFYYTGSSALGDTTLLETSASAGIYFSASSGGGTTIGLTNTASFLGTSNEIEVSISTNDITIGLPDEVTIVSASIGDLVVTGETTQIQVTNLNVDDQFILLNSHSATTQASADGGIIIQTSGSTTDGALGTALFYDNDTNRWALANSSSIAWDDTTVTPDQYVVSVEIDTGTPSGAPNDFGLADGNREGMMYVDTSDTDGDKNNIWIYA